MHTVINAILVLLKYKITYEPWYAHSYYLGHVAQAPQALSQNVFLAWALQLVSVGS